MKLEIFVDNVLTNSNKPCTSEDVKKVCDYICNKAKEAGNGANSVCIETVERYKRAYETYTEKINALKWKIKSLGYEEFGEQS